ncbi:MAG: SIMPL domain-containing protein [Candidatus Kapaibacterium sp.]
MRKMKLFAYSIFCLLLSTISYIDLAAQAAGNAIVNQSVQGSNRPDYAPNSTHNPENSYNRSASRFAVTDSTLVLDVSALMNVPADEYVAIFALEQVAPTADSATHLMNERIEKLVNEVKRYGVGEADLHVDVVSQIPMYSYQVEQKLYSHTFNEIPVGFSLRKNIHIRYAKPEVLEELVAVAAQQEIYDIVKVEYIVRDVAAAYDSLRSVAITAIQKKVKDFERLGVQITQAPPIILEGSGATTPVERYVSFSAFGSTSITASDAGREALYGSVKVNPADKPKTIYHNRIPFTSYDVVVNPSVVEPAVQFTYQLAVQYRLKKVREKA